MRPRASTGPPAILTVSPACARCRDMWHQPGLILKHKRVPSSDSSGGTEGPTEPASTSLLGPLAALARLPRLEVLELACDNSWLPDGIPTQWVAPGAFPALTK